MARWLAPCTTLGPTFVSARQVWASPVAAAAASTTTHHRREQFGRWLGSLRNRNTSRTSYLYVQHASTDSCSLQFLSVWMPACMYVRPNTQIELQNPPSKGSNRWSDSQRVPWACDRGALCGSRWGHGGPLVLRVLQSWPRSVRVWPSWDKVNGALDPKWVDRPQGKRILQVTLHHVMHCLVVILDTVK